MGVTWLLLAITAALMPLGSQGALRLAGIAGPAVAEPMRNRLDWSGAARMGPVVAVAVGAGIGLRAGPALGLAAWLAVSTAVRMLSVAARRRDQARRVAAAALAAQLVHAELCAGADAATAVRVASEGSFADDLRSMSDALGRARDPTRDVAPELHPLAHALRVCQASGAPASTVLETVCTQLQDGLDRRAAVGAALAGARSSAVLLALLPALGVALGAGLGVDPLHVLFGTAAGHALVLIGVGLECAGLRWTSRMAASASEGSS